jgi:hypothetical protein
MVTVKAPKLWDCENPNLYTCKTTLYRGKNEIDDVENTFGFRTIRFDAEKGFFLNDKITSNFNYEDRNTSDRIGAQRDAVQDTLAIKNKFDYGIAGGLGVEFSHPKVGHFMLEGRYYYGLGDIYGNSKRDFFGRSNNNAIVVKLTYLFDIMKTNNSKIK